MYLVDPQNYEPRSLEWSTERLCLFNDEDDIFEAVAFISGTSEEIEFIDLFVEDADLEKMSERDQLEVKAIIQAGRLMSGRVSKDIAEQFFANATEPQEVIYED